MSVLLVIESRHSLCEGANHTIIQHKATVYNYRNASTYCRQDPRKWYWLLPSHLGNQHCHVEDVAIACLRFSFLLCKLVATHNDRHSNRFRDPYQLCLQHNLEKSLGPLDSLEPRYFEDQQCEGHVIRHISQPHGSTSAGCGYAASSVSCPSLLSQELPTQHRVRANSRNNRSKPSPHVNLELSSR
jgi:hypothetical protein